MTTRRDFLKSTAILSGALLGRGAPVLANAAARIQSPPRRPPIDLLVLGGTGFIGPHLVRHAVARGHRVTIFTRGRHDAELPSEVDRLSGDRNGQLDALEGKRWDAVVDDSATNPEWVRQSTELLKDSVGRVPLHVVDRRVTIRISTRGLDESAPVHYDIDDPKDGSETFGVAKAQCEREVQEAFGDRGIVVRPTYIVGPGDTTDRFPYWPQRLAKGGEVLAPGRRDDPVQIIDVRDLAEFMVRLLEDERAGHLQRRPARRTPLTAPAFYRAAAAAIGSDATLHLRRRLRFPRRAQDRRGDSVGDAQGQRRRHDVDPKNDRRSPPG